MGTKAPKTVTESLGDLIVLKMRKQRIPIAAAARHLGIGRDTFTRRLSGPSGFAAGDMERLAELLDTTLSELIAEAESYAKVQAAA